ncbi:Glycosyl transferase family 2 [Lachnospiraceae bacterium XBB1006]|nr:Glycosyl transferase family 2 [Lachnospiraceae bacterium XBB1006]
MVATREQYLMVASKFIENGDMGKALVSLVEAYEKLGRDSEILELIYKIFVEPNEELFKRNYSDAKEITNIGYDELLLDFIPINDTCFYVFDKERRKFDGIVDIDCFEDDANAMQFEYCSMIISEEWDLRKYFDELIKKRWQCIFVVGEGLEARVSSFFKLHGVVKFFNQVLFVENLETLSAFFEKYPDEYLPKIIMGNDVHKYEKLIYEMHKRRVEDLKTKRENVLLSICIPSYNRGKIAFESVKSLISLPFDSEIEIIVSDNGSEIGKEYYDMIEEMRDSRIKINRFKENQQYEGNINQVIKMATGKFIMLSSDEDKIGMEELVACLRFVVNHSWCGAAYVQELVEDNLGFFDNGINGMMTASFCNYITGVFLNNSLIKEHNIKEFVLNHHDNAYVTNYTHCAYAIALASYAPFVRLSIRTSDYKEGQIKEQQLREASSNENKVFSYAWPEARAAMLSGLIDIFAELQETLSKDELFELLEWQMERTYFLLSLIYKQSTQDFKRRYTWREACNHICETVLEICNKYALNQEYREKIIDDDEAYSKKFVCVNE